MTAPLFAVFSGPDFWEVREAETANQAAEEARVMNARAVPVFDHITTLMDAADDNDFDFTDLVREFFGVQAVVIMPDEGIWIEGNGDARNLNIQELSSFFNHCEGSSRN